MRFRPRQDAVEILSIELSRGWREYELRRPLDNDSVSVKHARMGRDTYSALLADLAVVGSAELKPIKRNVATHEHGRRLVLRTRGIKTRRRSSTWSGPAISGSLGEAEYAQPQAAVRLCPRCGQGTRVHGPYANRRRTGVGQHEVRPRLESNREPGVLLVGAGAVHCYHRHRRRLSSPSDASSVFSRATYTNAVFDTPSTPLLA